MTKRCICTVTVELVLHIEPICSSPVVSSYRLKYRGTKGNEPRIIFPSFVLAPARLAHRRGTRLALWYDEFLSMTDTTKCRNDMHRTLRSCLYHIFVAPVRHIIKDKHLEKSFGHVGNRCEGVFNNDCIQRRSRIDLSEVRRWIEGNDHPRRWRTTVPSDLPRCKATAPPNERPNKKIFSWFKSFRFRT